MNRVQPCEQCGCPTLYHVARSGPGQPVRMVCVECSRTAGHEVFCRTEADEPDAHRR